MSPREQNRNRVHPALVLGVFAEQHWSGRRVAVLGDSSTGLPELIATVSGRVVHAYDPDRTRAAAGLARTGKSPAGTVSYAVLDQSLDDRAGAFDAVVVPDLSALGASEAMLERIRGLLSARGFALIASPNPAATPPPTARDGQGLLDYYALYDALATRFEHVRMLGQAPFAGYSVAEFAAEGQPGVTIDASLSSDSAEPHTFVAVASDRALTLEPYTLIQLPVDHARRWFETLRAAAGGAPPEQAAEQARLREQLAGAQQRERSAREQAASRQESITKLSSRCAELEAELSRLRERQRDDRRQREGKVRALQAQLDDSTRRLAALRQEHERALADTEEAFQLDLDQMLERIAELEDAAGAQTGGEQHGAGDREQLVQGYQLQIGELQKALDHSRRERAALAERAARTDTLEQRLAAAEQRTAASAAASATEADSSIEQRHAAEIDALEQKLVERGRRVAQLQAQLAQTEQTGREMLREIERARQQAAQGAEPTASGPAGATDDAASAGAEAPAAAEAGQLEALLERCARYQADLQAAGWANAALRDQLEERGDGGEGEAMLEQALAEAREQLAALQAQLAARG